MNILAIDASYRGDWGQTRFFVDHLFRGASDSDAACEVVTLARLKINRCLSYHRCQTDEPRP